MINFVNNLPKTTGIIPNPVSFRGSVPLYEKINNTDNLINRLHKIFIKLSKNEIRTANKMTKEDAAKFYFNLITERLAIPEELKPVFTCEKICEDTPNLSGCYSWADNILTYFTENKTNKKYGNWWTFGLIRHELEHFRQNIDILRNKDTFIELCKFVLLSCRENNLPKEEGDRAMAELSKQRAKILKYYTESDKNSSDYKKTKKYLDNRMNYHTNKNRTIRGLIAYLFQPEEFDACKAQGLNWINYLKTFIFG